MNTTLLAALSALSWGACDFFGGLGSRIARNTLMVVLVSQWSSLPLLLCLPFIFPGPFPPISHMVIAGVGAMSGSIGLLFFFRALATAPMGVVSPVTAVITAMIPILVGIGIDGMLPLKQALGIPLALGAVWLIAKTTGEKVQNHSMLFPVLAGVFFSGFLISVEFAYQVSFTWPVIASRLFSMPMVLLFVLVGKKFARLPKRSLASVALSGNLEIFGNIFFALAIQGGRLDTASAVGSLYPAATVLMARIFLHEKLQTHQWAGVCMAIGALFLVSG